VHSFLLQCIKLLCYILFGTHGRGAAVFPSTVPSLMRTFCLIADFRLYKVLIRHCPGCSVTTVVQNKCVRGQRMDMLQCRNQAECRKYFFWISIKLLLHPMPSNHIALAKTLHRPAHTAYSNPTRLGDLVLPWPSFLARFQAFKFRNRLYPGACQYS
jgi:hypothetical protein